MMTLDNVNIFKSAPLEANQIANTISKNNPVQNNISHISKNNEQKIEIVKIKKQNT